MAGGTQHKKGADIVLHPHFIIELADGAHKMTDGLKSASFQVTKSAAIRAFRATATGAHGLPRPIMNSAGNLRGMVVSRRAKVVFNFSSNLANKFAQYDSALAFAGIVIEVAKDWETISKIKQSDLPLGEKARRLTLIGSTAVLSSVTGVVPGGAHLVAMALEGYCGLAGLATGGKVGGDKWVAGLTDLDHQITAAHQHLFSPEFMQSAGDAAFDVVYAHLHVK